MDEQPAKQKHFEDDCLLLLLLLLVRQLDAMMERMPA